MGVYHLRLREIQKVINDNVQTLYGIKGEKVAKGSYSYEKISNYTAIKQSMLNLLATGLYSSEEDIVSKHSLLPVISTDNILLDTSEYSTFINVINRVIYKSEAMNDLINNNLHSTDEIDSALVISLPSTDMSFIEFNQIITLLNESFKLLSGIEEFRIPFEVKSFDVGSMWLVISLGIKSAVSTIGNLVSIVQHARIENRQLRQQDEYLEKLQLDDKVRQEFIDATKNYNMQIYRKLAKQFLETNDISEQQELLSQMAKVVENFDKLLDTGVGFEAGINSNNDVHKSFPPLEEQKSLSKNYAIEALKKLENSSLEPSEDDSDDSN